MQFDWPIYGHQKIVHYLQQSIAHNHLVHAYLFVGPAQVGKRTLANFFAGSVFCQEEKRPCQKCFHCQYLKKATHPEFILVSPREDKNQITIEQIRQLISRLNKKPILGQWQLALIDGADKMTLAASNALLKTLEEPIRQTKLILVADRYEILPTIQSRCQTIKFNPLSEVEVVRHLKSLDSAVDIEEVARLSCGKIGWAIELIKRNEVWHEFKDGLKRELRIGQAGLAEKFKLIEKDFSDSNALQEKIRLWQIICRQLIRAKAEDTRSSDSTFDYYFKKSWPEVLTICQRLEAIVAQSNNNLNQRLIWENFLLNI